MENNQRIIDVTSTDCDMVWIERADFGVYVGTANVGPTSIIMTIRLFEESRESAPARPLKYMPLESM